MPARLAKCEAEDAIGMHQRATEQRLLADVVRDVGSVALADHLGADADQLEQDAAQILDAENRLDLTLLAAHGELIAVTPAEALQQKPPAIIDTIRARPDLVTATASRERLALLAKAGSVTTGVDASVSIGARNSLEKMLAHQAATAHGLAMAFMAASQTTLAAYQTGGCRHPTLNIEATRQANAAARMASSFQSALLTLQRLRTGGRQEVVVQHVHVGGGGQAVVAGQLQAGGGARQTGEADRK